MAKLPGFVLKDVSLAVGSVGNRIGQVSEITIPVMAGRNLAVLTEAATRMHILRSKGIDPAAAFMARHSHFLEHAAQ